MQKNLEGLTRSLLHSILVKCPDRISAVFPDYWDSRSLPPWKSQEVPVIPYVRIRSALELLIEDSDVFNDHRFCFFIDGLDEFEDPEHEHSSLVERLQTWTGHHPRDVKFCVSSREWPTFQDRLSKQQRMTLHKLTKRDIRKVVETRLSEHPKFQSQPDHARESLVRSVVSKAQGVFLWVDLVLKALWRGLEMHDSFSDLHGKVDSYSGELDDFFTSILEPVHQSDRKNLLAFFAVAMEMMVYESEEQLHLFHYSFLGEFVKDPGWAMKESVRDLSKSTVQDRIDDMRAQISGLSGGLLEVQTSKLSDGFSYIDEDDVSRYAFKDVAVSAHRTVYDFIRESPPKGMAEFLDDFDVNQAIWRSTVAQIKFIPWNSYVQSMMWRRFIRLLPRLRDANLSGRLLCKGNLFELLNSLDAALIQRQNKGHGDGNWNAIDWSQFRHVECAYGWSSGTGELTTVFFHAAALGFQDYILWSLGRYPNLKYDRWVCLELMDCVVYGLSTNAPSVPNLLRSLLERGFSANVVSYRDTYYTVTKDSSTTEISIWQRFLYDLVWIPRTKQNQWDGLEVFLVSGYDPHIWDVPGSIECSMSVQVGISPNALVVEPSWQDRKVLIFSCINESGEWASLSEFVDHRRPSNADEILTLIDRNNSGIQHPERPSGTSSPESPQLRAVSTEESAPIPHGRLSPDVYSRTKKLWARYHGQWNVTGLLRGPAITLLLGAL